MKRIVVGSLLALAATGRTSGAMARPGDLLIQFTKTWPIQEEEFCGETDNFARVYSVDNGDSFLWQTPRMETHDCSFPIGDPFCDPNATSPLRPIINADQLHETVSRERVIGNPVSVYRIELHDAGDLFCGGHPLDFVTGEGPGLYVSVNFRTGTVQALDPNATVSADGEICSTNDGGGPGLCFRATVEILSPETCAPGAPNEPEPACSDRALSAAEEISPGVYASQFDNLRPLASFVVGPNEEVWRGYLQPEGRRVSATFGFGIELTASTIPTGSPDPFSAIAIDQSLSHTYPLYRDISQRNSSTDSVYFPGDSVRFEALGVNLGRDPISVQMAKRPLGYVDLNSPTPVAREFGPAETWRLSEDTILVPVDVIEAYPTGSEPKFGELGARALFDDPNFIDRSYVVDGYGPGQVFTELGSEPFPLETTYLNGVESPNFRAVEGIVRPDDIFVQCGIQFRMRSYTSIEVSEQAYEKGGRILLSSQPQAPCEFDFVRADNMASRCFAPWVTEFMGADAEAFGQIPCSDDARDDLIEALFHRWKGTSLPQPTTGVQTIITGRISGGHDDNCGSASGQLTRLAGVSDGYSWAGVSADISAATALAHEFGHALLRAGNSAHSTAPNSLMLASNGGTHIFGCSDWTRGEIDTPFNCDVVDSSSAFGCETMRRNARSLAGFSAPPLDMEEAPIGGRTWTYGRPSYGNTSPATFATRPSGPGKAIAASYGYSDISSPVVRTTDLDPIGTEVEVEVYVPAAVNDPHWVGTVAVSFENIATSTYSYFGIADLTSLPRGAWSTLTFSVPANVRTVLLGDHPGALFVVTTNTSTGGILIDDFAFAGTLTNRIVRHQSGSSGMAIATNDLLSFELASDWTSVAPLTGEPIDVTHGSRALGVEASGWTVLTSRAFATSDLPTPSSRLGIDVFIPDPQPNPWWVGEVRMHLTCPSANLYNAFVGNRPLQNLFPSEYNHLTFDLPANVQSALSSSTVCALDIILNTQNGAGQFLLDRLGFE